MPGPTYVEVLVTAVNHNNETIRYRSSIADQPKIGDVVTFDRTDIE